MDRSISSVVGDTRRVVTLDEDTSPRLGNQSRGSIRSWRDKLTGRDSSLCTLFPMYQITRHVSIEGNSSHSLLHLHQSNNSLFPIARDRDDAMAMGEEEEGWGGAREGDEDGRRTRDGRRLGVE